ncbi:hypothetical protein JL720_3619 [Aureococcus anophagefferens]|nr:hypothetical protein JL720_3619 [Aureococcus anophagefferens]
MPETRVTFDGVELAPGALQSPLNRSLMQPPALHTQEGEPIVIAVLSDEFGERFRRDLAPADELGTFLVLAKDSHGPLWDLLRCPAADNHASVKDAVEDVLEMPGALDEAGASVSFCQGRPEHAEDYHTHFAHLVDGQFVGETHPIEDPASVSVAYLTQRSELARIGDPPFACVVADFPASTLRAGTRLDVAILHGDDKKDLLKFDLVVRMKLPQVIAQWVGQGIEPTIHRLHAGGEISEMIYDNLCDDVVCEIEEARSIRIAVDGGPERQVDYDDHLGALLGPSPPERVAVTVWLDDRRKKVPRTQWTKLQHGCWATMAKERVMRGEFIYKLDCWKRLTVSGTALASVYAARRERVEVGVALGLFPWPAGGDVDDEALSKIFDGLTIAANHSAAARSSSWAILYKNHAGFPTARHPDMDQPLHSGTLSLLKLLKLPELLAVAATCADAPAARRKLVLGLVGLAARAEPSEPAAFSRGRQPSVVVVLLSVLSAAAAGNKPSCALFGETFDTRPLLDALGRLPLQLELNKVPRAKEASLRFRRTLQRKHAPEAVLAFARRAPRGALRGAAGLSRRRRRRVAPAEHVALVAFAGAANGGAADFDDFGAPPAKAPRRGEEEEASRRRQEEAPKKAEVREPEPAAPPSPPRPAAVSESSDSDASDSDSDRAARRRRRRRAGASPRRDEAWDDDAPGDTFIDEDGFEVPRESSTSWGTVTKRKTRREAASRDRKLALAWLKEARAADADGEALLAMPAADRALFLERAKDARDPAAFLAEQLADPPKTHPSTARRRPRARPARPPRRRTSSGRSPPTASAARRAAR